MLKKQISPIVVSCRDSLKQNSQSFYGRFYLGPFEVGQGLTIANALRRSLLSELPGLGITSVLIDGVTHEYSTIPGVQETVFDVLLNLKQIIFKSTINLKKPQIGYLQIIGPKTVTANDLKLPQHIQCVNPEQHILTINADGVFNMKFKIRQGQNYLINTGSPKDLHWQSSKKAKNKTEIQEVPLKDSENFVLKGPLFNKVPKQNKQKTAFHGTIKHSKPILLDPVFMPVHKVNYVLEMNEQVHPTFGLIKKEEIVILEIWTNGSISPHMALQKTITQLIRLLVNIKNAKMLKSPFNLFLKNSTASSVS